MPDIARRPDLSPAKPSGDHTPLGGFVYWQGSSVSKSNWRRKWANANYAVSAALAMIGWLWFFGWLAVKVFDFVSA
jgi:hypothetical protein